MASGNNKPQKETKKQNKKHARPDIIHDEDLKKNLPKGTINLTE